jgi:hypothetical protein
MLLRRVDDTEGGVMTKVNTDGGRYRRGVMSKVNTIWRGVTCEIVEVMSWEDEQVERCRSVRLGFDDQYGQIRFDFCACQVAAV